MPSATSASRSSGTTAVRGSPIASRSTTPRARAASGLLTSCPPIEQFERMGAGPSLGSLAVVPACAARAVPGAHDRRRSRPRCCDHVFAMWAKRSPRPSAPSRAAYLEALTPGTIPAICADYRASFHLDREHDADDRAAAAASRRRCSSCSGRYEEQLADAPARLAPVGERRDGDDPAGLGTSFPRSRRARSRRRSPPSWTPSGTARPTPSPQQTLGSPTIPSRRPGGIRPCPPPRSTSWSRRTETATGPELHHAAARSPRIPPRASASSRPRSTAGCATGSPTPTPRARPPRRASTAASWSWPGSGLDADGHVGDGDPLQAIADALAAFPATELLHRNAPRGALELARS